ncbi:uncharacterized protein LOC115442005 isoform X1 [Manduca sexta]|nr:uncharacterized protein LOC115442005 isoform X1 [Manduca sexta]
MSTVMITPRQSTQQHRTHWLDEMRPVVFWLFAVAIAVAEVVDEPWYEEEDVDESYDDLNEANYRRRREVYDPNMDHTRVKRRCDSERHKRSVDAAAPRQFHQYEVHEFTDENLDPSSPPFEEMLAASADHYQLYVAPPKAARYLDPRAPVNHVSPGAHSSAQFAAPSDSVKFIPGQPTAAKFVAEPEKLASGQSAPAQFAAPSDPVQFIPRAPANLDGTVPAGSVPYSQPLKQLAESDQFVAAAGHHHKKAYGHGHEQGGGHAHHGNHYNEHGGKTTKGFQNDHHVDKGGKGFRIDEKHRKEYEDAAGKKRKHHDHADHKGSHEEEAHGSRGAHFDEKKGHKKGHKTKGYHNKYHKDEFHKEHKFYDDFHKSGEHHRFGKFHAKHASNESGKKKAHRVDAGHDYVERGKKGYSNKGHVDADHKGYDGKGGHEEHHAHHSDHGRRGGKEGGSQWGYKKN